MGDLRTRRLVWMIMMIGVFFLAAAVVAWLWNSIIPWVIGFPPVTYWQAAGLLLLTRILFGGIMGRGAAWNRPSAVKEQTEDLVPEELRRMDTEQKSEYLLRNRAMLNEVDDR